MDNERTFPYGVKYGLVFGLLIVVFSLIINVLGLTFIKGVNLVGFIILMLSIILGLRAYRASNGGLGFGQGLSLGVLTSLFGGIISSIFSWVYVKFIDPSFIDQLMEMQEEEMEKMGLPEEQLDAALETAQMFSSPEAIAISGVIGFVIVGFFLTLIAAAIMKKDKAPNWEDDAEFD